MTELRDDARYRLKQGGEIVASSVGPTMGAWREIVHYAHMYSSEPGEQIIEEHHNGRWRKATPPSKAETVKPLNLGHRITVKPPE